MITRREFAAGSIAAACALVALPRGARAQTVDQGLLEALGAHAGYENGFRTKLATGFYRRPDKGRPADPVLVAEIAGRLEALSSPGQPTLALVHYAPRGAPMRAWLIEPDGAVSAGVGPQPYAGTRALASSLGVIRRGALRAPRKRGAPSAIVAAQPAPAQPIGVALAAMRDDLLPGPIAARLAAGHGRLLVLPAQDSATAPLAALPLGDGVMLAQNWSVLVVPDLSTLVDRRRTATYSPRELRNAVIVGDPELGGDREYEWPALPGARREAEAIALLTGSENRLMLGEAATHANVIAAADGFAEAGMLYLASHALADPVNPMDGSFVALTGGRLTGAELRGKRFESWAAFHPLVVLSACQTALGKTFAGGSFGVARAFVAAGAGQVVASLWNVDDDATYRLMTRFADLLIARGASAEAAMRQAQLSVLPSYAEDPGAWASFTVFGAPSSRHG